MRESNFAFPAQNRACVCISSQLYDRRALDTTSPLPLFNSLTHLTYLTSTSPRIREIMTMDGGLERLVRILHDFCICPPPPELPAQIYGLSPPTAKPPRPPPTLNPVSFDKHAAYRFSLAFQCIVNIGVRGSEPIRGRVVQAGTLDVVGCILEAWLANKGFAVGPSSSATGMPRESREQRLARRHAQAEQRSRESIEQLERALQRQVAADNAGTSRGRPTDVMADLLADSRASASRSPQPHPSSSSAPPQRPLSAGSADSENETSTDTSRNSTPAGSNTPTGSVLVPGRDRSGTVIGRPIWDPPRDAHRHHHHHHHHHRSPPTDNSRPDTETEDDGEGDADVTMDTRSAPRVVGIVSDGAPDGNAATPADAHIIINDEGVVGGEGEGVAGMVSLEPNDDFAMGAPPGAPGAIDEPERTRAQGAPDVTPRAGPMNLPMLPAPAPPTATPRHHHHHHHHHHHAHADGGGPYRDEDVLLSLQLLAYLSKYPHVRQAFYKPRTTFHPASAQLPTQTRGTASGSGKDKEREKERQTNVFSLVERFTFRPSSSETELANPPPKLPPEIQYWAGVIMRNACRKDDSRGGIRQCANMLCGKWESYPREFAKCRRCRKAKYCGKECQSTAWSEGHRFWCSAKDGEDETEAPPGDAAAHAHAHTHAHTHTRDDDEPLHLTAGGTVTGRPRRDHARVRTDARTVLAQRQLHVHSPTPVVPPTTNLNLNLTGAGTGTQAGYAVYQRLHAQLEQRRRAETVPGGEEYAGLAAMVANLVRHQQAHAPANTSPTTPSAGPSRRREADGDREQDGRDSAGGGGGEDMVLG